ncbi:hypothetical protein DFJ73DRAFT_795206 [Zopfochytrium polystomum]|nr:hypothetical protein DFJ73DRAFT_795206 [Zopfochytrium polystomum]
MMRRRPNAAAAAAALLRHVLLLLVVLTVAVGFAAVPGAIANPVPARPKAQGKYKPKLETIDENSPSTFSNSKPQSSKASSSKPPPRVFTRQDFARNEFLKKNGAKRRRR